MILHYIHVLHHSLALLRIAKYFTDTLLANPSPLIILHHNKHLKNADQAQISNFSNLSVFSNLNVWVTVLEMYMQEDSIVFNVIIKSWE